MNRKKQLQTVKKYHCSKQQERETGGREGCGKIREIWRSESETQRSHSFLLHVACLLRVVFASVLSCSCLLYTSRAIPQWHNSLIFLFWVRWGHTNIWFGGCKDREGGKKENACVYDHRSVCKCVCAHVCVSVCVLKAVWSIKGLNPDRGLSVWQVAIKT